MTTEIEKTFFDTFGIEPEEEKYCLWECKEPSLEHVPCNKECEYQRHDIYYPEITDRRLLELICIHIKYLTFGILSHNVEKLKNEILTDLRIKKDVGNIYNEVRTLFEEEK